MTDIETRLRALVAKQLIRPEEQITREARFGPDLGADSLDAVEMSMQAEDEFRIVLEDDEALDAFDMESTFGAALAAVEAKLGAKVEGAST